MVIPEKGETVALSLTACPAEAPVTVGLSLIEVLTAVEAVSVTALATESSTLTVNVVVSVLPTAPRLAVGEKTS
jgi:hypothetical protein